MNIRPFAAILASSIIVFSCTSPSKPAETVYGNPYLPLWEHVPDGEPHVFEDPDNPGQYRVYVYGSHDTRFESFCGQDVRCWSASVDDLQNWRDEGPVFTLNVGGKWDGMWAPDVAEVVRRDDGSRKYYLYPHDRGQGRLGLVCVGDRPDGPFTPVNLSSDGATLLPNSPIDFDPGVLVEKVDDPNDPDYQRGFRAYVAWGIMRSGGTELDPDTMYSPRYGKPDFPYWLPSSLMLSMMNAPSGLSLGMFGLRVDGKIEFPAIAEGENLEDFSFFEASSFRKVGNKYVFIYSGHSGPEYGLTLANSTLRYAYADSPRGPWKSGGILVEARGPVLSQDGTTIVPSFAGSNTHGSIEKIGDQWYLFYHRAPRGFAYARQGMVAPVAVTADEKPVSEGGKVTITAYDPYKGAFTLKASNGLEYKGAEVTSEGFNMYGLPPYGYYSAGYACYMSNPDSIQDTWDIWDNRMDITGVKSGDILGYKYFGFGGLKQKTAGLAPFEGTSRGNATTFNLFLSSNTPEAFSVEVWIDGPWEGAWNGTKVGEISVPAGAPAEVTRYTVKLGDAVDNLDGKHALYLVAKGSEGVDLCNIVGLGFTKKNQKMSMPVPPEVKIAVGGVPAEISSHPVWATDENGLTDNTYYSVKGGNGEITVDAPSSVKVEVDNQKRIVRATYNGLTKTFCIE